MLVKQVTFETSQIKDGSVFIVSNILETLPQMKDLFKNMLVTVVVILVTTALRTYLVDLQRCDCASG